MVACASQPVATTAPSSTVNPAVIPSEGSIVERLQGARVEPLPTLTDCRPTSFVGVTFDGEAVEADTATGEILRTISVVQAGAIWRVTDGSSYLMASASSEPAGGNLFWSTANGEPTTAESPFVGCCAGWYAEPAPSAPVVAVTGSYFGVNSRDQSLNWSTTNGPISGFGTAPAWSWDLSRLFALSVVNGQGIRFLAVAEIDNDWFYAVELDWWPEDTFASGLAMAANGALITFQWSFENASVRGVIFKPDGSFVGEFRVEDGSDLGGIDPTGNFLIYVDGDGAVRWRDLYGDTGVLGHGFLTASW